MPDRTAHPHKSAPHNQSNFESGQKECREHLPHQMKTRMPRPFGIRGMGTIEVNQHGGDSLASAEESKKIAREGTMIQSLPQVRRSTQVGSDTNTKKTTEIRPFIVKKAAFILRRSPGKTIMCS